MTSEAAPTPPAYRLVTPNQVAVATLLGSPVAGGWILASSLRKLGRRGQAWGALAGGIAATAAMVAIGALLPAKMSGSAVALGGVFGMRAWAQGLLGPAAEAHAKAGGKAASWGTALGAGIAALLLIVGVGAWAVLWSPAPVRNWIDDCVTVNGGEVCFEDGAHARDAHQVAGALVALGMHPGESLSVKVSRPAGAVLVWFVVKDGAWDQDDVVKAFTQIGHKVHTQTFPNEAMEIRLADDSWNSRRAIPIE